MPPPYRHRADVDRNVETGLDPGRNPLPAVLERNVTDLPCTYWTTAERRIEGPEFHAVVEDARMIVQRTADIEVGDVIVAVRDRRGRVLSSGRLRVQKDLLMAPTHREIVLELVAGTRTPEEPSSGS
jgi:hypothetical protein